MSIILMINTNRLSYIVVSASIAITLFSVSTEAVDYHGRLTVGGFASAEKHEKEFNSTDRNDFATASTRIYMKLGDLGSRHLELLLDLRDKHDFFNKLDKERQQLSEDNTFQARQLSLRYSRPTRGAIFQVGRFHIPEAGATFADGAELGYRFSDSVKTAVFGGLNPKQIDKSYLENNENAQVTGGYLEYEPRYQSWSKKFIFTNAVVKQTEKDKQDLGFFFNNTIYQWAYGSHLSTLVYYYFEPRSSLQNGSINYRQAWGRSWQTSFTLLTFDIIEYERNQDLREELTPSPYTEAALKTTYKPWVSSKLDLLLRYGRRDTDELNRSNVILGLAMPRFFSKHSDTKFKVSYKKEFTKTGYFLGISQGYFSKKWELSLDLDAGAEEQTDGSTLHPLLAEINTGFQFSRKLFAALSMQYAQDEKVSITSAFFKLGYRFGNRGVSPIRDGAPPRGRL